MMASPAGREVFIWRSLPMMASLPMIASLPMMAPLPIDVAGGRLCVTEGIDDGLATAEVEAKTTDTAIAIVVTLDLEIIAFPFFFVRRALAGWPRIRNDLNVVVNLGVLLNKMKNAYSGADRFRRWELVATLGFVLA
jgi:hypothetical protein